MSSYLKWKVKIFDQKKTKVMALVKVVHSFSTFFFAIYQKLQKDLQNLPSTIL